jgi:succinate dehydrogenase / fumarate reductase cytochrome b subunit
MTTKTHERPVIRNVHVSQLPSYRWPAASLVSGMHRISGLLMFLLLPFVIWMFDASLSSQVSFDTFRSVFIAGVGVLPGWLFKLVALGLIWAYLHHLIAGVRHLWMDVTHSVSMAQGRASAIATLAASLLLTAVLGARLFGLF